jgi:transposase-like protein
VQTAFGSVSISSSQRSSDRRSVIGFVPGLIKATLERGLQAELTDHVGYEKGDPESRRFPNSRNDTSPKTVASEIGDIGLDVPRDRDGSFEPRGWSRRVSVGWAAWTT